MLKLAGKITAGGGAALVGAGAYKAWTLRVPATPTDEGAFAASGTKFVRLPDGRKLEYSVYGAPNGVPIYMQHGYMGSCFVSGPMDALAKEMGVKVIAASMPGFGLSDAYPLERTRKLSEWPADVAAVLDQENVKKCHMYGVSAGCVHVAALARGLPEERVGNVLFCTPTAPDCVPGVSEGISPVTKLLKSLMGKPYIGDLLGWYLRNQSIVELMSVAPDCKAALLRGLKEIPADTEGQMKILEHGIKFTHRGIVDNYGTIVEPLEWLPELGNLVAKGHAMAVTSAPDDTTNPPAMQKWFQQTISGCLMMDIAPGWGHLHILFPDTQRRIYVFLKTGKDSFKR